MSLTRPAVVLQTFTQMDHVVEDHFPCGVEDQLPSVSASVQKDLLYCVRQSESGK